ncbi:MAG: DUF1211 domain-containing protein [Chitinophagaceae bacterium]|nr:DUF1211 domain-containing protein [Chitinophagaceae bacterium]MBK8785909.1 DUF1211 domain-containing protein [Chitinophagaceae bacterium]MBL0199792.1 DUF1211 domain-containing protein [Chitinophagaceae bacterium]
MSQHHTEQERQKFQLDRIALFSDAVFAIAITLLVIEIKVPAVSDDMNLFDHQFGHALREMIPEFIGFFISFIVIGNYWRAHHTIFGYVTDYNRKLISLNTWFLLTIVCMPFTTAMMSKYIFFKPYVFYCVNVIASGLIQLRLWHYIINPKNKVSAFIPPGMILYKKYSAWVVIGCFLLSLLFHKLIGPGFARMFLASIFIINLFTDRYFVRKYKLGKKY